MNFLKSWTPLKRRGGRRAAKVGDRDSNQRCHHNKRRKKGQGERRARAVGQVAAQIVAGQEPAAGGAGGRADVEEEEGGVDFLGGFGFIIWWPVQLKKASRYMAVVNVAQIAAVTNLFLRKQLLC